MKEMLIILFSAILVNNFVLSRFLGICPFLGVSNNLKTAMGMSTAVIAVLVLASGFTWPIYTFLLEPLGFGYLQTIVFILIIAALVQIIETILKKSIPSLYQALGIYLPLITTNWHPFSVWPSSTSMRDTPFSNLWSTLWAPDWALCWPCSSLPVSAAGWTKPTFLKR